MDVVRKEPQHGWIEVITGSMFSGKSEELIRRLRRAQIARQKVQIFKPFVDDRFSQDQIVSHSDMRIPSQTVRNSDELLENVGDETEVVGIDEGQFFDAKLPAACNRLADGGKPFAVEAAQAKLAASEAAMFTTWVACQTLAGKGYLRDSPVQKWFREAKLDEIWDGTSDIMRVIIGREMFATKRGS